jgi:GNAT superfamily N-acetyltransferase
MTIISVLENPEYKDKIFSYVHSKWGNKKTFDLYKDCIYHCKKPLPNWYVLLDNDKEAGCAGLIANDFISRQDLYPWLCALYIEKEHRGKGYGNLLIQRIKQDAYLKGFKNLYLCTDHVGYYEKSGFIYIGDGYHPWGETSRIYEINLEGEKNAI